MYDVRFLPAARQDMVDIARYIAVELKAADAARALSKPFPPPWSGWPNFPTPAASFFLRVP